MLITGARLFDGETDAVIDGRAVHVEGDRIKTVAPVSEFGSQVAAGRALDVSGRFVLPGLVNTHAHVTFMYDTGSAFVQMARSAAELTVHAVNSCAAMLAMGVTTARDMGGRDGVPMVIRDAVRDGSIAGPRLLTCGEPISVTGGHAWQTCVEADGADGFRKAARGQLKMGADCVKVMASHDPVPERGGQWTRPELTEDEMSAAFDVAHDWGRFAGCHVMGVEAIGRALRAGVDIIEHGHYLSEELAKEMARRGVWLTPTLSSYDVQTMHPRFERGEAWAQAHRVLRPAHQGAMLAAVSAGVRMTVGTDSVGCFAEEVDLMRQAGVSAPESLRAATSNGARALRLEREIGYVRPGFRADLVVLRSDPLADPYALEDIELVIKDGHCYRPEELLQPASAASARRLVRLASSPWPRSGGGEGDN